MEQNFIVQLSMIGDTFPKNKNHITLVKVERWRFSQENTTYYLDKAPSDIIFFAC